MIAGVALDSLLALVFATNATIGIEPIRPYANALRTAHGESGRFAARRRASTAKWVFRWIVEWLCLGRLCR